MKRLSSLLCLLPLGAAAQTVQPAQPQTPPLIRLYEGDDCAHYPGSIFKPNVSGSVTLSYTVGSDGTVTNVTITSGSGDIQLDRGATDCAKSWKFVPPQETGLPSTVSSVAIATFAASENHDGTPITPGTRNTSMTWRTPNVRSAATVAMTDIRNQAIRCMLGRPEMAQAAGALFPTILQVIFSRGAITRTMVKASSGSDALDKAAIACYGAIPKNEAREKYLRYTQDAMIEVPWRTLARQTAAH